MNYETPERYYYRLHHVRPRFKNNIEEVLLYMADAITSHGIKVSKDEFKELLIKDIYNFPGNATKSLKTVQNWRTEISALFSLYYDEDDFSYPSSIAKDLAESQDLTKFFKYFLYSFQYPGGHVKANEVRDMLANGIEFHPAGYILTLLQTIKGISSKDAYLTKAEACHLVFNDKRATTDSEMKNITSIAKRVLSNRKNGCTYEQAGDVIRYAGDILDYMSLANLLKDYAGKFYLNSAENKAIKVFLENIEYLTGFDVSTASGFKEYESEWVKFVAKTVEDKTFETDLLAFIAKDDSEYAELVKRTAHVQTAEIPEKGVRTKDIGDYGENLVYGHECMVLKINNRADLIHWVKCIPNQFAVGYDIQSVDPDEVKKYIEVKSTISMKKLTFGKFHLTKNELSSAQTLRENYYVYRLQLNKNEDNLNVKLWVIRDPVGLFKEDKIDINLATGEVNLKQFIGEDRELLYWRD